MSAPDDAVAEIAANSPVAELCTKLLNVIAEAVARDGLAGLACVAALRSVQGRVIAACPRADRLAIADFATQPMHDLIRAYEAQWDADAALARVLRAGKR